MEHTRSNVTSSYKIHTLYVGGMLVAIIIALTTSKWGDNPKLVDYVNFASTLTSLVLAVLAIVYAFLSNASISGSVKEIGDAATNIKNAATDVSIASNALLRKIEILPTQLDSVASKVDELLLFNDENSGTVETPLTEQEKQATEEIVDVFVERSSPAVWIGAFQFFKAFKSGKLVERSVLWEDDRETMIFFQGVMVTMVGVGLLLNDKSGSGSYFRITDFDSKLGDILEERFDELLKTKLDSTFPPDSDPVKILLHRVETTRSYFGE